MDTQKQDKAEDEQKHGISLTSRTIDQLIVADWHTLGNGLETRMGIDLELAQKRLEERRSELTELSEISKDARATVELDQQSVGRLSRMDAMQQQAMAEAQERTRKRDLARIELALRRIADGDYGYCTECGEEIPDGRLAIDPMAERCVRCA